MHGLSIPPDARQRGMWSQPMSWPLVAIHSALLPDGTVLTYGTPLGMGKQEGRVFDRWNPLAPDVHVTLPNSQGVDSFCSAGVLLPSGELLISGGNEPLASTRFDYTSSTATTEPFLLASDRWYGTLTLLPDGRSLMTGGSVPGLFLPYSDPEGSLDGVSMTPELYTPGAGWSSLFGADSRDAFGPDYNRFYYPRQWVAPDGGVFGISSETMWHLDPTGDGSIAILGPFKEPANDVTKPNVGPTSTAVMYDVGKILQVGGNGYAPGYQSDSSALATTIDINGPTPIVSDVQPMAHARQWAQATVLPTGRVLVTGGSTLSNNGDGAVYAAELWNPATGTWAEMASAAHMRIYHSSAILLPNGAVLSAGGGVPGPIANFNAEVYYPPYLFSSSGGTTVLADRPRMVGITGTHFAPGAHFQIEMADARAIAKVAIVGFSSTTHSLNMGQRYYAASFVQNGKLLTIGMPPSPAIAPPGYYLVFAIDGKGVPSRGQAIVVELPTP
jgi:galactose oxidase